MNTAADTKNWWLTGKKTLRGDHELGGVWGDHITFMDDQFWDGESDVVIKAYGHKPVAPKVGETAVGRFMVFDIKFEIIKVRRCDNPDDMFFLDMVPVEKVA